jgi:6-phosphogluconolactonase
MPEIKPIVNGLAIRNGAQTGSARIAARCSHSIRMTNPEEEEMLFRNKILSKFTAALALTICFIGALAGRALFAQNASAHGDSFVYVGTYTDTPAKGQGIYLFRYDAKTGHLSALGVAAEVPNPSFLATDPQQKFLYAVTERGSDPNVKGAKADQTVSSYSINSKTGALTFLNKVSSAGGMPCHLVVDQTGKMLFVADYGSGRVVSYAINPDGSIGAQTGMFQDTGSSINPRRQEGPHVHSTVLSPDNRFLFTPDLGLDQIKIYKIDPAKGTMTPNDPPSVSVTPGLGPRHFAFGRGAKFAYAICEMGSSVVVFSYDREKGALQPIQTISTLPPDFAGVNNSAEIEVDKSGRYLYASNRGSDSITVFRIDEQKGTVASLQVAPTLGKGPRNFKIDPAGKFLIAANQNSDQLVLLKIDPHSGQLTPGNETIDVPSPVCVIFVPVE